MAARLLSKAWYSRHHISVACKPHDIEIVAGTAGLLATGIVCLRRDQARYGSLWLDTAATSR